MKLIAAFTIASLSIVSCVVAQETDSTTKDRNQIQSSAEAFVAAYNERDLDALVGLFAEDAEVVYRDGFRSVGRDAIRADFAEAFQANPQAKLSLTVDSLRFVTADVAQEAGRTTWFPDGKTATVESTYRVAHLKRNGKWQIASVRTLDDEVLTNYEYLRDLSWLVGDWIDEDGEGIVETSCRWSESRAFLLRKFTVTTRGQSVMTGTQRIGWDPTRKQFRSWTYDSEGSFVEGFWTPVDGGYIIRSTGFLKDGSSVSGTTRVDLENKDRMVWSLFNRLRGEELMPDVNVTMVRRPPTPSAGAK